MIAHLLNAAAQRTDLYDEQIGDRGYAYADRSR
jgi:hypothetical protein